MRIDAERLLRGYNAGALQQMARVWKVDAKSKTKDALVKLLARDLYAPERIQRVLADLTVPERAVLDRVVLMGGHAPTRALRRVVASRDPAPSAPTTRSWAHARPADRGRAGAGLQARRGLTKGHRA